MNLFELFFKIGAKDEASGVIQKLSAGFKGFAAAAGVAVGAAIAGMGKFAASAVKTGEEFDVGMSQIAATLGITTDEIKNNVNGAGDTFDALRAKALEMGSATNFSATQAAEGLNILAMSGFDAGQSMSMIEDVLHLAAAGSMDMASAAGYVSGAMKGFADDTKDAGYYADLMAKGATLANTSVSQLGDAMSSGAATAKSYGQTADSMTVSLLRLAEQGEVGAAAGTALASTMKNLYTPTDQAKQAMDKLGVSAYNADGSSRDLNVVVDELSAALDGMSDAEANAYKQSIFDVQGLKAFNKMAVTSKEKTEEWTEALAGASDGMGEAAKQYETMTDNLKGDIDILNSAIDGLKIAVSDELTPTIREFVQFGSSSVSRITEAFSESGLKGAMGVFGEILSEGVGMIVENIPMIVDGAVDMVMAFAGGIIDNTDTILDAFSQIITLLVQKAEENLPQIVEAFVGTFAGVITAIAEVIPQIASAFVELVPELVRVLSEQLPAMIDAYVQLLLAIMDAIPQVVTVIAEQIPTIVTAIIDALLSALPELVDGAVQLLMAIVDAIPLILDSLLEALPQIIETINSGFTEMFPQLVEAAIALFMAIVQAIPQIIDSLTENLPEIINTIINTLIENIPMLLDGAIQLFMAIIQALPTIIRALTVNLPRLITTIVTTLLSNLPVIISAAVQLLMGIIQAIPQITKELISNVPQIIETIVDGLSEGFDDIVSVGSALLDGIWSGIKSGASTLWSNVKGWAMGLLNDLKGLFGIHSPSRVFRDQIGKMLAAGMGVGFDQEFPKVESDIESQMDGLVKDLDVGVIAHGDARLTSSSYGRYNASSNESRIIKLYLDGDKLVGETADRMDSRLGNKQEMKLRWEGAL